MVKMHMFAVILWYTASCTWMTAEYEQGLVHHNVFLIPIFPSLYLHCRFKLLPMA